MKKTRVYSMMIVLFAAVIASIVFKYKRDEKRKGATFYLLQDRKGRLAETGEWKKVKQLAANLMKVIRTNPDDFKSRIALATLYIQEARITGNYVYYDVAAMKYVNEVLEKNPENFEALTLKALLYLSQHHFADGLVTAQKAKQINPYNAFVYGMLVDGNVEMGNYDSAVANSDKMVSIRPDIRSYSRISYLREIYGDYPGAIEAMKMAVEAGAPTEEGTEWARVQLSHLYENIGDMRNAEMYYTIALDERPNYAYAIAGLARVALTTKNYTKAISLFIQADSLVNDYSFKEELVEVYRLVGEKIKSDSVVQIVIKAMSKDAQSGKDNENIGHYADRELAYAYLKTNNYDKALEHALAEYNRRPGNIDVNETVAWVYFSRGDYQKAMLYIKTALKTNSKNPTLLCRAGLIFAKAGNKEKAKEFLKAALKNNPNISEVLKNESANILQSL
ncbi:MAG: tetratricopeptide repeat protein [Bacteroidota bacterium]|nr:tetratricopeptide repeat protein [Bacteroidota bacterium]